MAGGSQERPIPRVVERNQLREEDAWRDGGRLEKGTWQSRSNPEVEGPRMAEES
jgi:hypothetical protein